MTASIIKELHLRKNYLTEDVETIYFGGGTPSLLTASDINKVLEKIRSNFELSDFLEITLEANPDDLSFRYLKALREIGINRLSIGIQSFDDDVLKFLNRAHSYKQAENAINDARNAGFDNISVDLIYGIPDRNDSKWKADINKVFEFEPEHISAYCLTIEPKTVFGNWVNKGKLALPEEEQGARQFEILLDLLENEGYEQYEISNFSKPNFYSSHNTSYWKQIPYLGVGPSAHSFNISSRQFNVANNAKYINALKEDKLDFGLEYLSEEDKINEYLLTSMRTKWGVDLNKYNLKDQLDSDYLDTVIKLNKAYIKDGRLYLTKQGKLVADQISSDLFITK